MENRSVFLFPNWGVGVYWICASVGLNSVSDDSINVSGPTIQESRDREWWVKSAKITACGIFHSCVQGWVQICIDICI